MTSFLSRRNSRSVCLAVIFSLCGPLLCSLTFSLFAEEKPPAISFQDVTDAAQIAFQHRSPVTVKRHLHLMMGSGVGWIDYDRDGFPDLYGAQGEEWSNVERKQIQPVDIARSNRLYWNRRNSQFQDVTAVSGLTVLNYSMGIAVGDYNHDGFDDLYVSAFGRNLLYCNQGDGTFSDVSATAHVDDPGYGASCTWADLNGDGLLDLYVANYLEIDRDHYPICSRRVDGARVYFICHPRYVPGQYDVLYLNLGNGSFLDVSQKAGLHREPARQGLGVFAADYDQDGDIDLYVANDSVANQLWINNGQGIFTDQALVAGLAFNRTGDREAGMGLAAADYNGDGELDLFVTNYFGETNTLYRNEGALFFLDVTDEIGLAAPSRARLGFGTSFLDVNNDGWEDLFVTNGHVHDRLSQLGKSEPYEQEPQLFLNLAGSRFNDVSAQSGEFFRKKQVGRGCAVADFNQDGLVDLAISHLNERLVLLENRSEQIHQSIALQLVGTTSNRSAIGAVLEVTCDARKMTRLRKGSSSYLSADEAWITCGLGDCNSPVTVKVRWPGGKTENWTGLQPGGRYTLIEGTSVLPDQSQTQP
ncbi:CRTAC1 family protein [Gimesia algae]|uniref:FG-GAP repeat protein n=1 Tax=Gimesia algae TaxID=2527971 RepID=A0A517VG52_9PLAN|nr:CRTAC1 family protein [Gimesia algae]QDT91955.1 FG-GAP repeat protein [Gimesia algae]